MHVLNHMFLVHTALLYILMFAFIPALSQIPCKYHAIQHHLQRLRLHQPAITPIHNHPTHT